MQGFLLVNTEIVRDQLDIHKSMEPDGAHPRALQDPVGAMAGPLSPPPKGPGTLWRFLLAARWPVIF